MNKTIGPAGPPIKSIGPVIPSAPLSRKTIGPTISYNTVLTDSESDSDYEATTTKRKAEQGVGTERKEKKKRVLGPQGPPAGAPKVQEAEPVFQPRSAFADSEKFIWNTFKKIMHDWDKDSMGDKMAKRTLSVVQTDMEPFFELLKKKGLGGKVLDEIEKVSAHIYQKEYIKAEKIYLDLSIGKDAWPIGIGASNTYEQGKMRGVAYSKGHLLNDISVAKYLKSIKRLLTYSKGKYKS